MSFGRGFVSNIVKRVKEHLDEQKSPDAGPEAGYQSTHPDQQYHSFDQCHSNQGLQPPSEAESHQQCRQIIIRQVEPLGNVKASLTRVERDLGFQGKLGERVLLTYGDTMYRDEDWSDRFIGITSNSIACATPDPTEVHDLCLNETGHPNHFLEPAVEHTEDNSEYALGITNIVEVGPNKGIIYYLLNHRPGGHQNFLGAGVAEVFLDAQYTPRTRRLCRYWWDGKTEPHYGDICSVRFNDYVYAYGHMHDSPWVYLARVPVIHAFDLHAYEYWNGATWQRERLQSPNISEKEAIFWKIQQGQIVWSSYHSCLIFVYCDAWWTDQVLIRTATCPQGPWSEPQTVYKAQRAQEGGCIYSAIPHPYYDETGKTLIITYTNMPNIVQAIKVYFG